MTPRSRFAVLLLLVFSTSSSNAAELPPLGDQAAAWVAAMGGHGAVATAEKRNGQWTFAISGQPFAAGHAEVAAQKTLFEIGSISKVFTGILLPRALDERKLRVGGKLGPPPPGEIKDPPTRAPTPKQ